MAHCDAVWGGRQPPHLKYGALSSAAGLLDLACTVQEDEVVMVWTERGGPTVTPPANLPGFGSRLLDRIVTRKLRGSIDYQWDAEGLIATLRLKAERLLA